MSYFDFDENMFFLYIKSVVLNKSFINIKNHYSII
jgi:hypothetical protein